MSAALLLAAGSSRRFGSDKRLHPLPDGRPILLATVQTYLGAFDQLWVVTRTTDDAVTNLLRDTRAQQLHSKHAAAGMGHSLAEASQLIRREYGGALVVGLADMPFVTIPTLTNCVALLDAVPQNEQRVIQPRYADRPGNPVGFSPPLVARLSSCQGDQGARRLIADALVENRVTYFDVDDAGVVRDIDTPLELPES